MNRTEVIARFLEQNAAPDLARLYTPDMEVQVNVKPHGELRKDKFVKPDGKEITYRYWTDGTERWKHFRIPWKADTDPEYEDKPLRWNFDKHVEAIGLTGWDWRARCSRWVGFDFDSIANHTGGLTDTELLEVQKIVESLPWTVVRKSKSGAGVHVYVFLDPVVETNTHTEHAALARAILSHLSGLTGYNMQEKVDKLGGILWIWHANTLAGGFDLIKDGIPLDHVPPNWIDHKEIVAGKRRKISKRGGQDQFAELERSYRHVKIDDDHLRLLRWFESNEAMWWWDSDHHMLVCHTYDLKRAHRDLEFKGIFETVASGKDCPHDQNCFAFPKQNGAWTIRRHGADVNEHSAWKTDTSGWTRIEYNVDPDFATAVKLFGAIESSKGEWVFDNVVDAVRAVNLSGAKLEMPPAWAHDRTARLTPKKREEHRIIFHIDRQKGDDNLEGFLIVNRAKTWERIVTIRTPIKEDSEVEDELVRHVVASGKDAGLYLRARQRWIWEPRSNIMSAMSTMGMKRGEADRILGSAVLNFWELVSIPFAPVYPGNRQWNRDAAQLAFEPKEGEWNTWDRVLKHVGRELTPSVRDDKWCKANGIGSGGEWLFHWVASMFQYPAEPLPYLFFFSQEEDTGKSSFHESLSMLFADGKGYARANTSLTEKYNGELIGAVFCAIEELDLKSAKGARERIKDYVTSPVISIHAKFGTPYNITNTTHWVQCSNNPDFCPVFPGDTRITSIYVRRPAHIIPKPQLREQLLNEAPAFLHELLNCDIPDSHDRLRIPCLDTGFKAMSAEANRTLLEEFIDEEAYCIDGQAVKFSVFFERFVEWLPADQRPFWSKVRVGRELPHWAPRGRWGSGGHNHIGNITFRGDAPERQRLVRVGKKLKEIEEE